MPGKAEFRQRVTDGVDNGYWESYCPTCKVWRDGVNTTKSSAGRSVARHMRECDGDPRSPYERMKA